MLYFSQELTSLGTQFSLEILNQVKDILGVLPSSLIKQIGHKLINNETPRQLEILFMYLYIYMFIRRKQDY